MKKTGIYILIFTLLFSFYPMPTMSILAEEVEDEEEVVLFSKQIDEEIPLFEKVENIEQDNPGFKVPDESHVFLLQMESSIVVKDIDYSHIRYMLIDDNGEEQSVEGYVESEIVVSLHLAEEYSENRMQEGLVNPNESDDESRESDETELDSPQDKSDEVEELEEEESSVEEDELDKSSEETEEVPDERLEDSNESSQEFQKSTLSVQPASVIKESKTSKLGHIRSGNVKIYKSINGASFSAGEKHTNAVYYIKKQAKAGNETYYLISTQPSATKGIVGWVKSKDMSINTHAGVDKKAKTFYIKGNGKATTKAWGGSKDTVYANLSKYQNKAFKVHLTEKVGNNTWYRGNLDGKTVWLHSSYVNSAKKSKTSKLGHIRSGNVQIYESIGGKSFTAGEKLTNAVYYIKEEAKLGNDVFYLISTQPSATKGIIGWVKSSDLSTHAHVGVDKQAKTFYVKGNGKATTKAWGGSKDAVYPNLAKYKHKPFQVHLTEKVGNNTWYRGKLDGKTVWLHSNYVTSPEESKVSLLGHIRSSNTDIYKQINGNSFKAGSKHTNAVYYIKKQAKLGNENFYLISTQPSATKGIIGWVNSKDMSIHNHKGVDKKSKLLYINGKGKATSKAWGGSKDTVYSTLSKYKNDAFYVHLTEKVGNNTWYRGKLNGKTVWLHSSSVNEPTGKKISKLGHIRSGDVSIYESVGGKSFKASSKHRNKVYYIKMEKSVGKETYYLISTEPSNTNGALGWVKSSDLSTHNHVGLDKHSKVFYIKGNGKATTKAWGGSQDTRYSNLSKYKNEKFHVNLTEKVGNNIWYRGNLRGETVWLHSSYVIPVSKLIVLDPGHGGKDPGSSGNGLREKDIALEVSLMVRDLLEKAGYAVIMTRENDKELELKDRTTIANNSFADLFLSIHVNAGGGTGIETWFQSDAAEADKSKKLASSIQGEIIKETKERDRGVKDGNLHINRESKLPSALVELGFIDTKGDADKLKQQSHKNKLAQGIVKGIKKYFSLF